MDSSSTPLSSIDQYVMSFTIGHGTFGHVRLAFHRMTGTPVAIKILRHTKRNLRWILSEMAILEMINHPHIIQLFQTIVTPDYFYIITEYVAGGNLMERIIDEGSLTEEKAKKIFRQIVGAVKYCHGLGIAHRDLKPQNILLDGDNNAKIIDFGLGIKFKAGIKLHRRRGTYVYNAPELFLGEGYDGRKADIWSLGVILYVMTIGHLPFIASNLEDLRVKIIRGEYQVPSHVSGQLENLIHQILTVIPEKRATLEDTLKHPWFTSCEEYSEKITKRETRPDPNILGVLKDLGYDTQKVCESLKNKEFDDHMAIYLILKEQFRQGLELGSTIPAKPVDPGTTPPPSPTNLSISPVPMRTTSSEPPCGLSTALPYQKMPTDPRPLGQRMGRCTSQPLTAFRSPTPKESDMYVYVPPRQRAPASSSEDRSFWQMLRDGIVECIELFCCCCCLPIIPPLRTLNTVSPEQEARTGAS